MTRCYMAYLWVQVLAVFSYLCRSVLYMWAISGTRGSSGFGSVSSEQIDSNTLEIVSAGLHWSFKMSRQMLPLLLIFGWNSLVRNATCMLNSRGHILWNRLL
uniref:Csu456(Uce) n=1 Tax=Arundo donax TaxID=35708 RepID=A0A0A9D8W3_ARUDO